MLIRDFRVGKICNARRIIFHVLNSSCVIKGSLLMIGKIQLMHFCTQFPNIRSGKMCPRAIKTSSKLLWKNILLQLQEKQQQQTSFLVSFSQKFMWFMFGNELRFCNTWFQLDCSLLLTKKHFDFRRDLIRVLSWQKFDCHSCTCSIKRKKLELRINTEVIENVW